MGLLDSTQDSTDSALAVMAARPLDPIKPEPKHSAWSVIPRAVAAGAVEVGANVMDTLGAAGQVAAASGGITPGFDPNDNQQESQRMADRLKSEGIDWRSDEGQQAYNVARELRPDPVTAGRAEQIIFGLSKGLTKAVGASVALGPVGGAVTFGASEGMTAADDLAREGVDLATRTKVGAVSAALNTAGMALPVAGNTLAKTVALGLAGGPASFIAQQAATRSILENADYHEIAQQYDPLDPVGLSIATLLPAGFGAWAMRGARGGRKGAADTVAPAVGERAAATPETVGAAHPDHVDAAMVHNLTAQNDLHETRLGGVGKQITEGVIDPGTGVSEAVVGAARKLREFLAGPAKDQANNSDKINFAAVEADAAERIAAQTGVTIEAGARHEAIANMVRHSASSHPDLTESDWGMLPWLANRFDEAVLLKTQAKDQGPRIALSARDDATGYAYVAEYRVGKKKGERLSLVTFFKDNPASVASYLETNGKAKAGTRRGGGTPDAPMNRSGSEALTSATNSGGFPIQAPSAGKVNDPHLAAVLSRIDEVKARNPDMPVAVREDGSHATAADEIAAIRKQAQEGTDATLGAQDASLLQVAAECFLSLGG